MVGIKGKYGYASEGVAGYCFSNQKAGTIPLYRHYGNGDHFYTTTAGSMGHYGYKSEGIACYVVPA